MKLWLIVSKKSLGNFLHFNWVCFRLRRVTQPLAMLVYEKLLPGSQLMNRLQDMGYRLLHVSDPKSLRERAEAEKPLVVLSDLEWRGADICAIIRELRNHPATSHLPVLAFVDHRNQQLQEAAREAGATLVAGNEAILSHLPQLLDQALEVQ